MSTTVPRPPTTQARAAFLALHHADSGFVMPNAWDAGSAVVLADVGFPAIATTSAGIAFSLARPDNDPRLARLSVTRAAMFERVRQIGDAVTVPVNADLQDGYGETPDDVASAIQFAIDSGLAGANIEDKHPLRDGLYDERAAVERISAARAVIDAAGVPFVLTARTDAFLASPDDAASALHTAIRRCSRFREAGADCLYPPGVADLETIGILRRELAGPLNIVTGLGRARLHPRELIDAGVTRVSLGGSIARAALGYLRKAARELRDAGTIHFTDIQINQPDLNVLFAAAYDSRPTRIA